MSTPPRAARNAFWKHLLVWNSSQVHISKIFPYLKYLWKTIETFQWSFKFWNIVLSVLAVSIDIFWCFDQRFSLFRWHLRRAWAFLNQISLDWKWHCKISPGFFPIYISSFLAISYLDSLKKNLYPFQVQYRHTGIHIYANST